MPPETVILADNLYYSTEEEKDMINEGVDKISFEAKFNI